MQTSNSILILLAASALSAGSVHAEPAEWKIDPEHFSVAFEVDHINYQRQIGMFLEAGGSFRYDPESGELADGRVEVDAASVFTNHDERDEHVRGDDFLAVEDHPRIVFEASGFEPDDDDGGTLTGDLTLLGRTHPVELDVTINKRGEYPFGHGRETLGISAQTTIERSRWGMDYAVSNELVGDEVALRFEFEAIRQ
ncbi:MAG: YceI family protein [Wenzhouxiangellaceae bacterium]|nr:YceI family protein [Wenzhouxiangellaceae bacterium]MBS3745805.1 YceI family protein [Wenzhouxiangellaceae bacterium]MBS3824752.1 YceI family protein [Wenzhouxiangellaceae bacterium]